MDRGLVTELLKAWKAEQGPAPEALIQQVYDTLHDIARRQLAHGRAESVEAMDLVHLAYEQLEKCHGSWNDRTHFFAFAARVMRHVLVDRARANRRAKRGGGAVRVTLTGLREAQTWDGAQLLDLEQAFAELEALDARKARICECHFFAGMGLRETAQALGVSVRTVERDIVFAKAWLADRLAASGPEGLSA